MKKSGRNLSGINGFIVLVILVMGLLLNIPVLAGCSSKERSDSGVEVTTSSTPGAEAPQGKPAGDTKLPAETPEASPGNAGGGSQDAMDQIDNAGAQQTQVFRRGTDKIESIQTEQNESLKELNP